MRAFPRLLVMVSMVATALAQTPPRPPLFPEPGPIADADPSVREEREILVPDGFRTARTAELMAICENAGPLKSIKLMVGHQMVLGTATKLYVYPEGAPRPEAAQEGLRGGTPEKVSQGANFYLAEPFGFLERGKPYVVEWEVTIFETDIPSQHMWSPQGKNYKVLWQSTFRQTPKEEPVLPPDIQADKERMERIKAQPVPMPDMPQEFLRTESENWKRVLATKITAGFRWASVRNVLGYLSQETSVAITLDPESYPAKPRSIFRGFDHKPLRAVLYEIGNDTRLLAEWKLGDNGEPIGIVLTDRKR